MIRTCAVAVVACLGLGLPAAGHAEQGALVFDANPDFANARTAGDLRAIGAPFLDDTDVLSWSNERFYRGREAVVKRVSRIRWAGGRVLFQDLLSAAVSEPGDEVAILHMPLTRHIGAAAAPGFLVGTLFRDVGAGRTIAALVKTDDKDSRNPRTGGEGQP